MQTIPSFNRTFMELKLIHLASGDHDGVHVLIGPSWN